MKGIPKFTNLAIVFVMVFGALGFIPTPVQASTGDLRLSQVYGGGGNSGAPYTHDFIEIFNAGNSPVPLDGLSLQYASATGTGLFGGNSAMLTELPDVVLEPGQYFLVQEAGGTIGSALPDPDFVDSTPINMSASSGKVVLVTGTMSLGCNGGSTLCDADQLARIIDLVGYGSANFFEGSAPAPGLSNTMAAFRADGGCTDTDDNVADFVVEAPFPRNSESPLNVCGAVPVIELKINEFVVDHAGTDTHEYIEVFGAPNTNYSDYVLLQIEGDGTGAGIIDSAFTIGQTDENGLWWTGFMSNVLENGTLTLLLVKGFTGIVGDDIDTNNDGVIDNVLWESVVDSVAIHDGGTYDLTYGVPVLAANFDGLVNFKPGGASRIPDGFDTDSSSDWVRNDFYGEGLPGFTGAIQIGEAYNTPGQPNAIFIPPPEACGDPFTPIYDIQGSGMSTPLAGLEVSTEGIVVGDFQDGGMGGFFIQDPLGDGDPNTSDGIFVHAPSSMDVGMGDHVRVRGTASEYYGLTQVGSVSQVWMCEVGLPLPEPTELTLPVDSIFGFERLEGMLVTIPQDLVIAEYYNFGRYGEIRLTAERFMTFTAIHQPDVAGYIAWAEDYFLNSITLDDGRSYQNPDPAIHPNGWEFNLDNLFRGGDLVTNVTGVMDYSYSLYRIQPIQGADYTVANPRPVTYSLEEGDLKIASFNVLNYFTTLDTGAKICSPLGTQQCRGADTTEEFVRQRNKILAAMSEINADVFGLMEIENDRPYQDPDYAVVDLVNGLNDILGEGTYDYIRTGAIGTDAIKVALLYKPATVTRVGDFQILTSDIDPRFNDLKNRPTLAQVFIDHHTGETFTVAVNHLKSKGSDCNDLGDFDLGDGAGSCNLTRLFAAEAMVDWLANGTFFFETENVLIIGDLNAYDKEDPIVAIKYGPDAMPGTNDDYYDLIFEILGDEAYTYVFDGQMGYLDYALASTALMDSVVDVAIWHINADEPSLIDYDMSFKKDAQAAIYAPDAYRSSDHDPVIVSLRFDPPVVAVDIMPGGCPNPLNVRAPGILPVAILGTADFDVMHIDPASVLLEGISPLRWSYEDVATVYEPFVGKISAYDCTSAGPDGYLDLVLHFDSQALIDVLGYVADGDVLVLKLTGNLVAEFWNIPFSGEDVVLILNKGR